MAHHKLSALAEGEYQRQHQMQGGRLFTRRLISLSSTKSNFVFFFSITLTPLAVVYAEVPSTTASSDWAVEAK